MKIEHRFVDCIPESIESGVLYISIVYATAAHLCVCGCGREVVTPFSPTDWKLLFDGEAISLTPSIGNWKFQCRSHYWIKRNKIEWAENMSIKAIAMNPNYDRLAKEQQFTKAYDSLNMPTKSLLELQKETPALKVGFYTRLMSFFNKSRHDSKT